MIIRSFGGHFRAVTCHEVHAWCSRMFNYMNPKLKSYISILTLFETFTVYAPFLFIKSTSLCLRKKVYNMLWSKHQGYPGLSMHQSTFFNPVKTALDQTLLFSALMSFSQISVLYLNTACCGHVIHLHIFKHIISLFMPALVQTLSLFGTKRH